MTHRRQRIRLVVVFLAMLLLPVTVGVQSRDTRSSGASAEWLSVGGDAGNTRYSTLNQITAQNVTKLGAAWKSPKMAEQQSNGPYHHCRGRVLDHRTAE